MPKQAANHPWKRQTRLAVDARERAARQAAHHHIKPLKPALPPRPGVR